MTLIDLAAQCCDADDYLDTGYLCAKAGLCYNPLRPVGDSLWFGIPYYLDLPESTFFYLHLMLVIAVAFSAWLLINRLSVSGIRAVVSFLVFMVALGLLLLPTFFHTLSDTPAALFLLEGCLLALGGSVSRSATTCFMAGLSLGCAALLRAAYVLPIGVAAITLAAFIVWQIMASPRKPTLVSLCLFSFLLPLSAQFYTSWKHTGHWTYLSEARTRQMMHLHLDSTDAGYDTQLPQTGVFWATDCVAHAGIVASLQDHDIGSVSCLLKSRSLFLLGSYAADSYGGSGSRNFLDNDLAEKIGAQPIEIRSLLPLPPGDYRFSIWLWPAADSTAGATFIDIDNERITPAHDSAPAARITTQLVHEPAQLDHDPKLFTVDIRQELEGYLVARIAITSTLHARGAALEPAASASGYRRTSNRIEHMLAMNTSIDGRHFSYAMLAANLAALTLAVLFLCPLLRKTGNTGLLFVGALMLASFLQCLAVIPEQRYAEGTLAISWLLACLWLSTASLHKSSASHNNTP